MRIFWIDAPLKGRLAIMPRPLGGERLADEIAELKAQGVSAILSLLEDDEVRELSLGDERDVCALYGVSFQSFPIPDRGLPADPTAFRALTKVLAEAIESGASVAVHCRAGIGRSSLAAAGILAHHGVAGAASISLISSARHISVPDTDPQLRWILALNPEQ